MATRDLASPSCSEAVRHPSVRPLTRVAALNVCVWLREEPVSKGQDFRSISRQLGMKEFSLKAIGPLRRASRV
jgi:hypothetical protein